MSFTAKPSSTTLARYMRAKKLTISQVSKDTGLSYVTVSRAYHGTHPLRPSSADALQLYCNGELDMLELLRGDYE